MLCHLGAMLSQLGVMLGDLGAILGPHSAYVGATLGLCWASLGPSWAYVGPSGGSLEPCWACVGPSWGSSWPILGLCWGKGVPPNFFFRFMFFFRRANNIKQHRKLRGFSGSEHRSAARGGSRIANGTAFGRGHCPSTGPAGRI